METFGRIADETELLRWKFEGDRIVRAWSSLNEQGVLEANAGVRLNGFRKSELMQPMLRMSRATYEWFLRKFPVLRYGSKLEQSLKWEAIARDPEYRKLWLQDKRF
jgi:hypothetical protein